MELTLVDFVLFVLVSTFALVAVLAMISRFLHAKEERRALANRIVCRLCLHAFESTSHLKTVDCPICGAANEKGRSRRLG